MSKLLNLYFTFLASPLMVVLMVLADGGAPAS